MENFNHLSSCSHHSGDIDCFGITLASGRVAIITKHESYEADCESGGTVLWGIAQTINWRPRLSARYGGDLCNKAELLKPTIEEIGEVSESGFFDEIDLLNHLPK
jgi:hypothetical protein